MPLPGMQITLPETVRAEVYGADTSDSLSDSVTATDWQLDPGNGGIHKLLLYYRPHNMGLRLRHKSQVGSPTRIGDSADIEIELRYLSTFKSRKIVCKSKLQKIHIVNLISFSWCADVILHSVLFCHVARASIKIIK